MKNVPKINISDMTPDKIKGLKDGYKVFDLATKKYYEKVGDKFQEMIEEGVDLPKSNETDYTSTMNMIDELVAKGDKLNAANLLMNVKTTRKSLLSQKDMVNQKINFMFNGTSEQIDIIQARVSEVTEAAIKKATIEEMRQFFVFDGTEVTLNYDDMLPDKDKKEAYREFLLYLKSIADAENEIDTEVGKIDELINHFDPDMVEKSNDVYVWDEYVDGLFKEKLEDPNIDDKERALITRIIELRESASNLQPMVDYIKEEISAGRRKSLIHAFHTRFADTLKKAQDYANENGFNIYFQMFDNIEETIGITEWRNIFIFIFARYIKFNANHLSKMDNAFIAQVVQNLIMLKKGQLKEPDKSKFAAGIKSIIALLSEP